MVRAFTLTFASFGPRNFGRLRNVVCNGLAPENKEEGRAPERRNRILPENDVYYE
jgi:hypothetical protein